MSHGTEAYPEYNLLTHMPAWWCKLRNLVQHGQWGHDWELAQTEAYYGAVYNFTQMRWEAPPVGTRRQCRRCGVFE